LGAARGSALRFARLSGRLASSFTTGAGDAGHQVPVERGLDRQVLRNWYGFLSFRTVIEHPDEFNRVVDDLIANA
jgi:hypothetical protein